MPANPSLTDRLVLTSLRNRQWPAWIGIWALLMLFAGPAISQLQAYSKHQGDRNHHAATGHDAHRPAHHGPSQHPSPDHAAHAQCGYCTLTSQSPLAAAQVPNRIAGDTRPLFQAAGTARAGYGTAAVFPAARVRAPPLT